MLPAAFRFAAFTVCTLFAAAGEPGAHAAVTPRSAPTRPGAGTSSPVAPLPPLAGRKIAGVDCVNVADAAARLGLAVTWLERGRRVALTGPNARRTELEADERDATVNGLRVFFGHPVADAGGQLYLSRIDFERCLTPMLRPGLGLAPRARPQVIALDPGHGGRDHGKTNEKLGVNEKTFTLDTALRLKKLLEAAGYRVVLTRDDDTFVDLAERAAIANVRRADLFLSIHFNALDHDTKTSGVEVFTFAPQFQNSSDAWSVGRKPDAEDELSPVNAFDHWSVVLAQPLHRALLEELNASDRGKKLMHLKALRPLKCPGVLVECGFLTSEVEARKIATPAYRQKIAEALLTGIRQYAATLESLSSKPAPPATTTAGSRASAG